MSKIGRPPIPPAERRTKIVQVPVNVAELQALDALRTEGESRAAAVRRAVAGLGDTCVDCGCPRGYGAKCAACIAGPA